MWTDGGRIRRVGEEAGGMVANVVRVRWTRGSEGPSSMVKMHEINTWRCYSQTAWLSKGTVLNSILAKSKPAERILKGQLPGICYQRESGIYQHTRRLKIITNNG